jgi:predicted  nucleic acid-binding Zn-ribbon protein
VSTELERLAMQREIRELQARVQSLEERLEGLHHEITEPDAQAKRGPGRPKKVL